MSDLNSKLQSHLTSYRPQTKLREGNVFTGVRDSVHGGGPGLGGCLVWGVSAPGGCLVQGGVSAPGGIAWSRGVSALGGGVPGGDPPRRLLLQAVRILLECILVLVEFRYT